MATGVPREFQKKEKLELPTPPEVSSFQITRKHYSVVMVKRAASQAEPSRTQQQLPRSGEARRVIRRATILPPAMSDWNNKSRGLGICVYVIDHPSLDRTETIVNAAAVPVIRPTPRLLPRGACFWRDQRVITFYLWCW
ncbi:hypothetical protein B296_00015367 [Ensete ventricosum]|uniref:Uncharacterized protein n=1 Tax=Ensete ventricosum TaxID=4639 RepID=A0A426ZV22_ENSVE|nr:hypothetical protein B296_00015367 [Ensete ventricosum]